MENWKKLCIFELTKILKDAAIFKWLDLFSELTVENIGYVTSDSETNLKKNFFGNLIGINIQFKHILFFNLHLIDKLKIKSIYSERRIENR